MSSDPAFELPQRSGTFRAVVQSGHTITSYLRAGAGRPVVLLSRSLTDGAAPDTLVRTLGASFRVLVPQLPTEPEPLADWLVPFLDGLGLAEVAAVADHALAPALLRFAHAEPDRISRIVILSPAGCGPLAADGVTQPLLCACIDCSIEALVGQVAWFLAGAPERLDPQPG